ncbi:FRG domain-containing protein [Porphyromonas sp.]
MSIDTKLVSSTPVVPSEVKEIKVNSVAAFVAKLAKLDRREGTETFYRGHADKDWELIPSILRTPDGPEIEHRLFRDMVAHEPQSFSECRSALDHLVQMQHYGLPTRLLDVSMNPLVALYFACEETGSNRRDGAVCLFTVPEGRVKHYDSDAVSALTNLAKCEINDVQFSLYPQADLKTSFYEGLLFTDLCSSEERDKYHTHEAVSIGGELREGELHAHNPRIKNEYLLNILPLSDDPLDAKSLRMMNPYKGDDLWVDGLWRCILLDFPSVWPDDSYLKWFNTNFSTASFLRQIREEKPSFFPMINPYDLLNVFFVKAKYDNPRILNQSGAFLLFGLGLTSYKDRDGYWGPLYCDKRKVAKVPEEWIKRKFIIPSDKKVKIRKELANLGITDSYIYPGMEQYAKELKRRYRL